jgi:hypothetical protein
MRQLIAAGMTHDQSADKQLMVDWPALNQRLRDNGFAGLPLHSQSQSAAAQQPRRYSHNQQQHQAPDLAAVHAALDSVLTQYDRRARLVQELLAATDLAREREAREDAVLSRLRK